MLEKLQKDIVESMKNKDRFRLTTLREIKGAMDLEHINKQVPLTDELLIDTVSKQIKMRNESLKEFVKASRADLVEKTEKELEILKEYLPKQLDEEEIKQIIDQVFEKVNPKKPSDMGLVMRELTPLVRGKADMGMVSSFVKAKLDSIGE